MNARHLALALALFALGGCGFHLRGGGPAVAIDPASPAEAVTALRQAGLTITPEADRILTIEAWRWQRETISVDAQGRPEGYRLHLILDYRLRNRDGRLLDQGRLRLFRDYLSPPEQALSREAQEAPLRQALWREAAERLSRRATP